MNKNLQQTCIAAFLLLLPLIILASNILTLQTKRLDAKEILLPIAGFDPRDMLRGHYVTFRFHYEDLRGTERGSSDALLCVTTTKTPPGKFDVVLLAQNDPSAAKRCTQSVVINPYQPQKFFLSEEIAEDTDRRLRDGEKTTYAVVGLQPSGQFFIKNLQIDGRNIMPDAP